MKCEKCGTINNEQDRFCMGCGSILNKEELNTAEIKPIEMPKNDQPVKEKDETKSALLSMLIGFGGILAYWFIGLRYTQAFAFVFAGIGLGGVGFKSNKLLGILGIISNIILSLMAIYMFYLHTTGRI